jgi:hypothetical protein
VNRFSDGIKEFVRQCDVEVDESLLMKTKIAIF